VTDASGQVVFDSNGGTAVGADYSRWNDVYLTLRGKYGSRSTRDDPDDEESSVLYVAAPIEKKGRIVGVLTVVKPQKSMAEFMDRTEKQVLLLASVAAVGVALMGVLFSAWITYPIRNLIAYAKSVRDGKQAALPTLGHSEIRTLGLAFEQMRDALEGKDYVHRYVQTLTHEIKSPVAAIQGAAELLHEEMPAEDRRRFLANIQAETGRIQEAIDSLLLLASVESKKALDHAVELDFALLLRRVAHRLSGRAGVKTMRIQVGFSESLTAPVEGDPFLLERAFLNLLENAVAFGPCGSDVRVELARCERFWNVAITDSGPGIPDYAQERVFERFYSLPRPDTGKKSSGLGLAFVKEVALLHGGSVSLCNRDGGSGGSVAVLSIPARG
jgi:two-component system sensor histidine kinase CreC